MNHGIQVKGEHGILQIDGFYKNMSLYKKGIADLPGGKMGNSNWGEYGPWNNYPFDASTSVNLMAFIPTQYCVANFDLKQIQQCYGFPAGKCEIFCFSDVNTHYFQATHGLQVRNPDTLEEVFNSNWALLRIVDVFNLDGRKTGWRYPIPAGKKYAVAIGGGIEEYKNAGFTQYSHSTCFKIINNTIYIDIMETSWGYRDDDEMPYIASLFDLSILIIDVTGY